MPVKAGTRFDRYEITAPLSAGAMGGVYFTFDWSPDGKQLACTRGFEAREIVLISNFR